ncbi:MAG TPA: hypothetical protein VME46_25130 [Acidimicrobiales bacterium]|nr:hypothetical protein [Acidimicrobiales bacterium]
MKRAAMVAGSTSAGLVARSIVQVLYARTHMSQCTGRTAGPVVQVTKLDAAMRGGKCFMIHQ